MKNSESDWNEIFSDDVDFCQREWDIGKKKIVWIHTHTLLSHTHWLTETIYSCGLLLIYNTVDKQPSQNLNSIFSSC